MSPIEIPFLGQIIRGALALDKNVFIGVQHSSQGIWIALIVVGLAGLSESLGQSLVLFINRVRPRRFIPAVLISAISYIVGYMLWTSSVWLVGTYAFGRSVSWWAVAAPVGLAYAPQLLAFFELTPFFGNPFGILLSLWSLLAIVVAVRAGLGLETWQAILASGLGWALIQVWRRTLGRPIYALGRWFKRRAVGVPLRYTLQDLPRLRRRPDFLYTLENWTAHHNLTEEDRVWRGE